MAGTDQVRIPATTRPPILFLSHSGVDTEAARELKRRLEESPAGRQVGLKVWFDKDDLPVASDWQESLEEGIGRHSTAFAVYVGTKGVVTWVRREVRLALSRATDSGDYPFIPIIAREAAGIAELPPFARQHHGVRDPLHDPAEMERLLRAVLGHATDTPVELIEEPYVGLRAMDEAEADRFFGREAELDQLVEKLRERKLVAVIADSGTGKSSLVRAGLIPAWRRHELAEPGRTEPDGATWHVVVMRPGLNPAAELVKGPMMAAEKLNLSEADKAACREHVRLLDPTSAEFEKALEGTSYALLCGCPAGAAQTLLVVDQFEELFTQTPPEGRAAFVELLLYLTTRSALLFRVVLTLRVDYASRLGEYSALRAALDQDSTDDDRAPGELRLKALSEEGLASIVHEPMRLAGHRNRLERGRLLKAIRQDLDRRPGDTALLAVALHRLWATYRSSGSDDLLTTYQEIGRIAGALGNAAREAIGKLKASESMLMPGLWARLVQPGDGRDPSRRIARVAEFSAERQRLVQSLADVSGGRLLLTTDATVEIAHEALFGQWDTLLEFVRENAEPLRVLGRLMERAKVWGRVPEQSTQRSLSIFDRIRTGFGWLPPEKDGREGGLERGIDLTAFAQLATQHPDWLSDSEHQFVAASQAEAARVEANDRWVARSLKLAALTAAGAAAGMATLGAMALWQWQNASDRALSAEAVNLWQPLVAVIDRPDALLPLAQANSDVRKRFIQMMLERTYAHGLLERRPVWWEPGYSRTVIKGKERPLKPVYFRILIDQITGHRGIPGDPRAGV